MWVQDPESKLQNDLKRKWSIEGWYKGIEITCQNLYWKTDLKRLHEENIVTEQLSNNSIQSDTNIDVYKNVEKGKTEPPLPRCTTCDTVYFSLEWLEIQEESFMGKKAWKIQVWPMWLFRWFS